MHLEPADYLRLDVPHSLGATAAGASFATSSGDILDVECFGPGAFRLRLGPNTRPDYGILAGRPKGCAVTQRAPGAWTFTADAATLEISGSPLRIQLSWKSAVVLRSITDEHARGTTRLPTFGRLRQGGLWTAAFALASAEPVYGLGEKFGPLDKRGQLIHSQVEDAQGVNTGLAYKNTPFAWSPGAGKGAWGTFVHTPGMVTHGVGHPDWSHRSYSVIVEDEALDLFLFAGDAPSSIIDLYTRLTGRPASVPRWSLGLWVTRASYPTPDDAIAVA
jgi:alpha-D-xyloside xylohydrolase